MDFIQIKEANGKYKCRAEVDGKLYKCEQKDIGLAVIWAEGIAMEKVQKEENEP